MPQNLAIAYFGHPVSRSKLRSLANMWHFQTVSVYQADTPTQGQLSHYISLGHERQFPFLRLVPYKWKLGCYINVYIALLGVLYFLRLVPHNWGLGCYGKMFHCKVISVFVLQKKGYKDLG